MSYAIGTYKKTSVQTASREEILLMLYQGAIKNCKLAIAAIEAKQIAKKGEHIGKFQDIIMELNNSLDFSKGEEIAGELSGLYDFILRASTQANIEINAKPLHDCLSVLSILYAGWKEAITKLRNEKNIKSE